MLIVTIERGSLSHFVKAISEGKAKIMTEIEDPSRIDSVNETLDTPMPASALIIIVTPQKRREFIKLI